MKTVVTLTAPTCSGKSSVEAELEKMGYKRAISHTTRSPREGELDGVHYNFVAPEFFTNGKNKFVECVFFDDNSYGVHESQVAKLDDGEVLVIVCEPNGVIHLKEWCLANRVMHVPIFLNAPVALCHERLAYRLVNAYTGTVTEGMLVGRSMAEIDGTTAGVIKLYAKRLSSMVEEFRWKNRCLDLGCVSVNVLDLSPKQLAEKVRQIVGIYQTAEEFRVGK